MKDRPEGFLSHDRIDHGSEVFSYIQELHTCLWRFIRAAVPSMSGKFGDLLDAAVEAVEGNADGQVSELGQVEGLVGELTSAREEIDRLKTELAEAREYGIALTVQRDTLAESIKVLRQGLAALLV